MEDFFFCAVSGISNGSFVLNTPEKNYKSDNLGQF